MMTPWIETQSEQKGRSKQNIEEVAWIEEGGIRVTFYVSDLASRWCHSVEYSNPHLVLFWYGSVPLSEIAHNETNFTTG